MFEAYFECLFTDFRSTEDVENEQHRTSSEIKMVSESKRGCWPSHVRNICVLLTDWSPPTCVPSVIARDSWLGAELGFHFLGDPGLQENGSRVREVFHWQMPIALARCNAVSIWMELEMAPMAWACFEASTREMLLAIRCLVAVGRFWANQWSHHCQMKILCKADPIMHNISQL